VKVFIVVHAEEGRLAFDKEADAFSYAEESGAFAVAVFDFRATAEAVADVANVTAGHYETDLTESGATWWMWDSSGRTWDQREPDGLFED
jgi:hypothetical protein